MSSSITTTRVAIFTIFALCIGIALLSIDSNQEEKRRLSSSNQLIGQGSTLLNTRQKVGACNGVEVTVTKIDGLKNNGDWITGNDLYLKVSPEPEAHMMQKQH